MKHSSIIKFFFIFILLFCVSCKKQETTFNSAENATHTYVDTFDFTPTSTTNQIIYHDNYTLSYVEKYEQAEWVAYTLKKENLKQHNYKRPYFIQDTKVTTRSADWRNYKNSGYDKGHLCPAGDMTFSTHSYDETFLTSNISPQKHNFNSGIWNRLEQKTRYWAEKHGDLYVISGGILTPGLKTIGYEKVAVPNYFYKILAYQHRDKIKVIAFLVPHKDSKKPLYSFVTSVDEIEKLTNIDFFSKLEDTLENKIERNTDYKDWSFN